MAVHQQMDLSFLQEANWPRLPSATAEVGKNYHNWLSKISKCMQVLVQKIETLEKENESQKTTTDTLSKLVDTVSLTNDQSATENASLNWANLVAGNAHQNEKAAVIMATVATELRRKEERAQTVIAAVPVNLYKEDE
ncbi:hypothetical protein BpHYR1_044893 [Brachionus plicatilis]|uniref:Uncharacterized protein n=1 Tax=Brachionus plicatilis TaxID=10195 RepID=A0A3M7QCY0_BRAPC|nr:hypothetical protein BpHYR1_044893 [Brachionus plicatilis]